MKSLRDCDQKTELQTHWCGGGIPQVNFLVQSGWVLLATSIAVLFVGCANNPEPPKQVSTPSTTTRISALSEPERTVIRSVIVSRFTGLNRGNLYELANGQMWEQTEPWNWRWIWNQPEASIITENGASRLKVEQIDRPVFVSQIHPEFESRITNDFTGFQYGAVFELDNGQAWGQTDTKVEAAMELSPKAVIWMSIYGYKLKVGNVSGSVAVEKLR